MLPNNYCKRILVSLFSCLILSLAFTSYIWAQTTTPEKTVLREGNQERIILSQSRQKDLTKEEAELRKKAERAAERKLREEEKLRKKAERAAERKLKREEKLRKKAERKAEKEAIARAKKERREAERKAKEEARLRKEVEKIAEKKAKEEAELRKKEKIRIEKEASDYITVKSKSAKEFFEDANYLCSIGKHKDALPLYNYAYDIARDKALKKEILAVKKKVQHDLIIQERERQRKILKEEKLREREKQQTIKALYKEAFSFYSQGNLTGAKGVFERILAIDPTEKKAKFYIDKKIPAREKRLESVKQKR